MANSRIWALNLPTAASVCTAITLLVGFLGVWLGFGGRRFAVALGVAAVLFAFELCLGAPQFFAKVQGWLGRGSALAAIVPLLAVLAYVSGVTGDWKLMLAGAAYSVLPALLLSGSAGKPPGRIEDYLAACLVWLPVEFRWMYRLFPYPPPLTHTLTILLAMGTGVGAFVLVRRLDGVGYAIQWCRGFGTNFALHFVGFVLIAIPVGVQTGFIAWGPSLARFKLSPLEGLGILLFTAWPEEFLFRGVLQNLLSRTFRNEWAGLIVASVIFGFSHILHKPFPNWKYVVLAMIAGFFYGHAYMKTRSLVPGALVHGLVDISWHVLFR
jgi:uncharacterized protein